MIGAVRTHHCCHGRKRQCTATSNVELSKEFLRCLLPTNKLDPIPAKLAAEDAKQPVKFSRLLVLRQV
jgi:hypothetical protein